MPTVPSLQSDTPGRVQTPAFSGQQNIQTNVDMFGGGAAKLTGMSAKLMNAAAEVGENAFLRGQKEADDTALLEFEMNYDAWRHDHFNNKQTGLYSKKGKFTQNATADSRAAVEKYFSGAMKAHENNPRIRNRLQNYAQAQARSLTGEVSTYERSEMGTYRKGLYEAKVERASETAVSKIIGSYAPAGTEVSNEQARVQREATAAVREGVRTIQENGKRLGQSKDEIDKNVENFREGVVESVVNNMLAKDKDRDAREFYDANKDLVTDEKIRNTLEKSLKDGSTRGESQRQTDQIYKEHDNQPDRLAAARKIEDPTIRDAVVKRLTARAAEDTRQQKLKDVDRFDEASKWLRERNPAEGKEGHIPGKPEGAARTFDDLPENMRPHDARLLSALRSQKPFFDTDAYQAVLDMRRDWMNGVKNGWEGEAGRDAIKLLTGKVDDATWKSIDNMHRDDITLKTGGADARTRVREARKTTSLRLASTETKRFAEMFSPVTGKPGKPKAKGEKADQKEALAQTEARLHALIDAWYADPDNAAKQLSKGQVQNWIFESLVEGENVVRVDRSWWNPRSDDDRQAMRFVEYMENYKGRGMFEVTEAGYDEMARLLNVQPEAVAAYAKQIKEAETKTGEPLLVTVKRLRAAHALTTGGN